MNANGRECESANGSVRLNDVGVAWIRNAVGIPREVKKSVLCSIANDLWLFVIPSQGEDGVEGVSVIDDKSSGCLSEYGLLIENLGTVRKPEERVSCFVVIGFPRSWLIFHPPEETRGCVCAQLPHGCPSFGVFWVSELWVWCNHWLSCKECWYSRHNRPSSKHQRAEFFPFIAGLVVASRQGCDYEGDAEEKATRGKPFPPLSHSSSFARAVATLNHELSAFVGLRN